MAKAEEIAEKYFDHSVGFVRWETFVKALNEMRDECAKESEVEGKKWYGTSAEPALKTLAARLRSL